MVKKIGDFFAAVKGDADSFDNYRECEPSATHNGVAYVSASTMYNGINGLVMPDERATVHPAGILTVAGQGQGGVGFAALQPMSFVAAATVLVLIPKAGVNFSEEQLYVIAAVIRKNRWRFGFGRPISIARLNEIEIPDNCWDLIQMRAVAVANTSAT